MNHIENSIRQVHERLEVSHVEPAKQVSPQFKTDIVLREKGAGVAYQKFYQYFDCLNDLTKNISELLHFSYY